MLTDRETELRDAYLKGYEDRANYYDKLVVDRYELAERYAVNQAKNNDVLDLVSKRYHFEWEDENNETQNFYYSATNEETAMNEFYSHYPNAKMVMVSWRLNVC